MRTTGPGRVVAPVLAGSDDKRLLRDVTGPAIAPDVARGIGADGRPTILFLRKSIQWSDGAPITADVRTVAQVGLSPACIGPRVVNARLKNVQARTCTSQPCRTSRSGHPEQWF